MKTFSAKPEAVKRSWYIIDASKVGVGSADDSATGSELGTLGRVASRVALILRGKHKPEFTPHVDTGDFVIVINAAKAKVTGNKTEDKMYYRHSQYPGGIKETTYKKLLEKHPTHPMIMAIKGMLPKNSLGRAMFSKLKVYPGAEHPHAAQQPETLEVLP